MLDPGDFGQFLDEVRGYRPFAWQQRLVDHLAEGGAWPNEIAAPAAAGKSAVFDVHVFANAMETAKRPPRSLAVVIDRRTLVDEHWRHAERLLTSLRMATTGVVKEVADRLRALATLGAKAESEPFRLHRLGGGLNRDTAWRLHPTACRIICATSDMWGSRLLFRGYGTSRSMRPVEAGLLAYDSVLMIDQAPLNQQLSMTARAVASLEPDRVDVGGPAPLQVVVATTTPSAQFAGAGVGVEAGDLAQDDELERRMFAAKRVRTVVTDGGQDAARIKFLTAQCLALREKIDDGTIGCVANTVAVAIGVADRLRRTLPELADAVRTVVGGMRPFDQERFGPAPGGLFPVEDHRVKFLVTTPMIEGAMDLDLAGMVTEIAAASALAQRFGRLNRFGNRTAAAAVVVLPRTPEALAPYSADDIAAATTWLARRELRGGSIAPWDLRADPPPAETPRRLVCQPVSWPDAEHWACSSADLLGPDPGRCHQDDLTLWLHDDTEANVDAFLVVRDLPDDPDIALRLLTALPPDPAELYRVSLQRAQEIAIRMSRESESPGSESRQCPYVFASAANVARLWGDIELGPGDILVISSTVRCFTAGTAVRDGAAAADVSVAVLGARFTWVGADEPTVQVAPDRQVDDLRQVLKSAQDLVTVSGHRAGPRRRAVADNLARLGGPEMLIELLRAEVHRVEIRTGFSPRTGAGFLVARDSVEDPLGITVQTWSSGGQVLLDDHQSAVADRAQQFAQHLKMDPEIIETLCLAGLFHDEGKRDTRFQQVLQDGAQDLVLAKSGTRSETDRCRLRAGCGLPPGWRHEQRSAAHAWAALEGPHRELVTRLVGTSHGHGRNCYDSDAKALLDDDAPIELRDAAKELFDQGTWDQLVERTNLTYGVWRMAYLEALLRAADLSVSMEGR